MAENTVHASIIVSEGDDCPWFLRTICVVKITTRPIDGTALAFIERDHDTGSASITISSEQGELDRLKAFTHELIHALCPTWGGKLVKADANRLFTALGIENVKAGFCDIMEAAFDEDDSARWRPSNWQ